MLLFYIQQFDSLNKGCILFESRLPRFIPRTQITRRSRHSQHTSSHNCLVTITDLGNQNYGNGMASYGKKTYEIS
jgi:hypothetical protein